MGGAYGTYDNPYKILVLKFEGKRQFGTLRRRPDNNIKKDLTE
jgi:hypothetical protein